jgi:hypothetical protein
LVFIVTFLCFQVQWRERDKIKWGGSCPEVTLEYDQTTGFLHNMVLTYNRRIAKVPFTALELKNKFIKELAKVGIWMKDDEILKGMDLGDDDDPVKKAQATADAKKKK